MQANPIIGAFIGALTLASATLAQDDWVISADMIYTAAGDPIEDGSVVVENGKIASVGGSSRGEKLEVAAVTPGLIDLGVRIDTNVYSVEQSTEAALTSRVSDTLDVYSFQWKRELSQGVTTALATPYDFNVLGGFCSVMKTGGGADSAAREIRADAMLRACIGTQPSMGNQTPSTRSEATIFTRRPTTRMGVEWVFRKTFYDAINADRFNLEVSEAQAERNQIVMQAISGELPMIVRAQATQDVRTAIYLKEEFGIQNMILDDSAEAWKELELVRRSGVGIVLPPYVKDGRIRDRYANDSYFYTLDSAAKLHALGVPIAISGHGGEKEFARGDKEATLAHQVGFALRGGLPFEAALEAVTIQPARMIGVDDRVGSIEVGKDADLVLWNGTPFEPTSRVIGVLIDGELVLDPRAKEESQ